MRKIFVSLFVGLSLLLAPIANAAGVTCEGDDCPMSEQTTKQTKSETQQDNDKLAGSEHHCCCPHVLVVSDLATAKPSPAFHAASFVFQQIAMTSVVVGPPLKPPSHV